MIGQNHPLLEREGRAREGLVQMRQTIREAYEFILPGMKHDLDSEAMPADRAPERPAVLDSTATEAAFSYAGRFLTRYIPPNESFIGLGMGVRLEALGAGDEISQLLEQTIDRFHRLLEASNFFTTGHRAFLDYGISTGALNFNETGRPSSPFDFEVVPLPQLVPEEGPGGASKTSFRRFKVLPRNIEAAWPDAKVPAELRSREESQPDQHVTITEALVHDYRRDRASYHVIWTDQGVDLVERTVGTGARLVFRNMLPAGCSLGWGPGLRALPDVRQLNKLLELQALADEQAVLAIWQAPSDHPWYQDGGVVDLAPGTVLPYQMGSKGLEPLVPAGISQRADKHIERLTSKIRQAFNDPLMPDSSGPVRSPTEWMERRRHDVESFEPAATRLDAEFMRPLATRGLDIMARMGLAPRLQLDGLTVKIVSQGPLARLRRQNEAREQLQWYAEVAEGLGAEVVYQTSDVEAFGAHLLEDGGLEPVYVLDGRERQQRREEVMQQQVLQIQAEQAAQAQQRREMEAA